MRIRHRLREIEWIHDRAAKDDSSCSKPRRSGRNPVRQYRAGVVPCDEWYGEPIRVALRPSSAILTCQCARNPRRTRVDRTRSHARLVSALLVGESGGAGVVTARAR